VKLPGAFILDPDLCNTVNLTDTQHR
jgi:hypothetical protein